MNNMSKISIIIPVYNAEKYIESCVNSLLQQTYKNIEIICIDDCSTDSSLYLLKQIAQTDNRVIVIESSKNGGAGAARNLGLSAVSGDYLMFCDNDDTYSADMCKVMLDTITEKNVDLVCCKPNIYFEDDYKHENDVLRYIESIPLEKQNLNYKNKTDINVVLWNKIFKTNIIKKYNIQFPNGINHEDDIFVFQYLAVIDKYFGLDKKLYNYMVRKTSCMATSYYNQVKKDRQCDKIKGLSYFFIFLVTNELYKINKLFFEKCANIEIYNCVSYLDKNDKINALEMIEAYIKNKKLPETILKSAIYIIHNNQLPKYNKILSIEKTDDYIYIKIFSLKIRIRRYKI